MRAGRGMVLGLCCAQLTVLAWDPGGLTADLEHQPFDALVLLWGVFERDLALRIILVDEVEDDCTSLNCVNPRY